MSIVTGIFLVILAAIAVAGISELARAIAARGDSAKELAELKEHLEQQSAVLLEAQNTLSEQTTELAELQERLDFAERLLAQSRDRTALGPGGGPQRS